MKRNSIKSLYIAPILMAVCCYVAGVLMLKYDFTDAVCIFAVASVLLAAAIIIIALFSSGVSRYYADAARSVAESAGKMNGFDIPVMSADKNGAICWYNESFCNIILHGEDNYSAMLDEFFSREDMEALALGGKVKITYGDKKYSVYPKDTDEGGRMFFFIDETRNYDIEEKYFATRPCIMYIHVDGLDLMPKTAPESHKTEIKGEIEKQIEQLAVIGEGHLQKISSSRYLLVTDRAGYDKICADSFSVLKKVRELKIGDWDGAGLSIGAGLGGRTIDDCFEYADNALEMALGRGGDQAVVKNKDQFTFFGGVAQNTQANSRVRSRIIAGTLKKLILGSENVYIMGHSYSDMDSFGAAFALCDTIQKMGISAKIIVDEKKTLASSLIEYTKTASKLDCTIRPETALSHIGEKTLLIVVDTHRPTSFESEEIFKKAKATVIIDHHRKSVDCADDVLLFYHDPSASSTCEMVAELIQYLGGESVGKLTAEALLCGIMLDTHNFVIRTGTRTFDASSFLRSKMADPVAVKKLFADTIDTYNERAKIVSAAGIYKDRFAVSVCDDLDCRVAASQAADELLNIQDVGASFVIYPSGDGVNISARSYGDVNVQLIMESLGGGGHQTMAAAQMSECDTSEAKRRLLVAIDEFLLSKSAEQPKGKE